MILGLTRDWLDNLRARALDEVFFRADCYWAQVSATDQAVREGRHFSRHPQDSPWYDAEKYVTDTLAYVDRVTRAVNGPLTCECGDDDE